MKTLTGLTGYVGIRGFIDKLFGDAGLRRGGKNQTGISPDEALNFLARS